jgi:hypothetical protein
MQDFLSSETNGMLSLKSLYKKEKDSGIDVSKIRAEGRKRRAKIKFNPACGDVQILILNFFDCLLLHTQYTEIVEIDYHCQAYCYYSASMFFKTRSVSHPFWILSVNECLMNTVTSRSVSYLYVFLPLM